MLQAATPNGSYMYTHLFTSLFTCLPADINKEIEITPVEPEDHTSRNKVYDLYAMTVSSVNM